MDEKYECYERGLKHGAALAAPAARLRAVPLDELGKAAWGEEDYAGSTWEEEREVASTEPEDERESTPYGRTCAAADRVRDRLIEAVEGESPDAAPARAVLVAVEELRAAFANGNTFTEPAELAPALLVKLAGAIGGAAGRWMLGVLAGGTQAVCVICGRRDVRLYSACTSPEQRVTVCNEHVPPSPRREVQRWAPHLAVPTDVSRDFQRYSRGVLFEQWLAQRDAVPWPRWEGGGGVAWEHNGWKDPTPATSERGL